jgi:tRNA (guanine37-N1)-methyltransferase
MKFFTISIFPGMFERMWDYGIVSRAILRQQVSAVAIDLRDFAPDRHRTTDDRPFGGGAGMVMKPEPLAAAIRWAKDHAPDARCVLMSPQGRKFTQHVAHELSGCPGIILVCGRYEGIDERIGSNYIDEEISIGDYILTGGEMAAMVIMDAVIRLIPGALGSEESAEKDSFENQLLEHAHFTRPRSFEGEDVPEVLLSGNHRAIDTWRLESSLIRTFLKRPDLLRHREFSPIELTILQKWRREIDEIIFAQSVFGAGPSPGSE